MGVCNSAEKKYEEFAREVCPACMSSSSGEAATREAESHLRDSVETLQDLVLKKDWKLVLHKLQRLNEPEFKHIAVVWLDENGKSLLHLVAESVSSDPEESIPSRQIIQELLNKTKWKTIADINKRTANPDRYTPLMSAVQSGNIGACYYFMTHENCNIELEGGYGKTAQVLADDNDMEDIMNLFDRKSVMVHPKTSTLTQTHISALSCKLKLSHTEVHTHALSRTSMTSLDVCPSYRLIGSTVKG